MEGRVMKLNDNSVKDILKHHKELTEQIHIRIIDIRKKIDETNEQLIEVASYPKIDLDQGGEKGGTYKDLSDAYLRYQHLVEDTERELTDEMLQLITVAEGIQRMYICFQALAGDAYKILNELYVKKMPYKTVESESGLNHRTFEQRRKQAIGGIQKLYNSYLTNAQIVKCSRLGKEQKIRDTTGQYEQMSILDILK